jgi:hypothetical protein
MTSQRFLDVVHELDGHFARHVPAPVRQQASPLLAWAAFNLGAGKIGAGLIDRLAAPGGFSQIQTLLSPEPFDVAEAAALSFTSRSIVTAMDLCAAALYRLYGGPGRRGGHEADVGTWDVKVLHSLLPPSEIAQWVWGLKTSTEWILLEQVRHGMTHRRFARTVKATTRQDRVPIDDIHVDGVAYQIDKLVHRFVRFGEDRFVLLCDELRSQFP